MAHFKSNRRAEQAHGEGEEGQPQGLGGAGGRAGTATSAPGTRADLAARTAWRTRPRELRLHVRPGPTPGVRGSRSAGPCSLPASFGCGSFLSEDNSGCF